MQGHRVLPRRPIRSGRYGKRGRYFGGSHGLGLFGEGAGSFAVDNAYGEPGKSSRGGEGKRLGSLAH